MKLRTRLVIAFITVTILPLFLSVAVIFAFGQLQLRSIERNYGITGATYESISNPIRMLSKVTEVSYKQLSITANRDVEKFEDITYLDSINQELKTMNSYFILREEEEIVYSGSDSEKAAKVYEQLPEYGHHDSSSENGMYIGAELQVLIKQVDFMTTDGAKRSAFIITDVSQAIPEVSEFVTNMMIAIVIILALTAATLIIWIYRGVAIPLGRMKIATQNIKDGNLDFEMEVETDDEIGQLCRDFEEMRLRLRETSSEKVEYDKKSKELISNISHDLKTPITAIKGYVEGIMDGVADTPEKMERYIKTIYNKANEMDTLINELTLYSKIDANRIPYNFSTIFVNDYFDDCASDLKVELDSRNIEFQYTNYVDSHVKIIADAEQIKRVINNIVSNSAKYMDKPRKRINLSVKDVGDFIQVEIEDNGK